jgi:hypothetical protein
MDIHRKDPNSSPVHLYRNHSDLGEHEHTSRNKVVVITAVRWYRLAFMLSILSLACHQVILSKLRYDTGTLWTHVSA